MINDEQTNPLLRMSLAELWELFPIILSPFNPLWKVWFEEEKSFLQQRLPSDKVFRISHIGSTAIGEIWAKPIIDIFDRSTFTDKGGASSGRLSLYE